MGLDIEKVAMLTSMVDKLIQMKRVDNALDESVVEDLIQKSLFISGVPYSDDEIAAVKRDVAYKYQIQAHPGESILADYEQTNWYDDRKAEIQQNFWTRYKNYLIDEKHFSPNVVSTLGNDTLDQKLMNYILDPKADYGKPVLKRGLIIGDVQSGKTSTYIGFICKAADAGYKVFILLTGTIESLRQQTQERVEEGFIGIDMSANTTGGKRVGVGLDNKPIHAMALTSRASDFRGNSDKIAVALGADKDAVVFVIKKNTTTLTKLTKWLIDLNADPRTHKIDMPMLMIDDEADNASINTSSDKEDPTKINKLIRKLADVFTKSNYVGFTATPFANVFIDPETTEKMETHDLFPEDFIVALPTPSNYIGPTRIFPKDAEFHSQLVYITDAGREEEDGYSFYFKHKKDWKGKLPESMTDAIYAFYLANAIRDLRGDQREHRSMLINISRFVKVQKYIKEVVEKIHAEARSKWNDDLSRITVEGGTDAQKTVYYTALYHLLIHPNILQDVNGEYPAMESDKILTTKGDRYTVFSLWDTYRNVHQLLTLVYPERQMEMVRTMLDMYREHGWLPKWELYGRETLTMEGDPSIPVIVDTWMKGLRDFDVDLAYEAMYKSATLPGAENLMRPDNDDYMSKGYVPLREQYDNSVSHALEYYIADFALSRFADTLGKKKDAEMINKRSIG